MSHSVHAAEIEQMQRSIDCTPICGSKFCCVAAQAEIAACVVGGEKLKSIVSNMMHVSAGELEAFISDCTAPENELSSSKVIRNAALDCGWGCCSDGGIARVFSDEKLFADVIAKTPLDQIAMVNDQRAKYARAGAKNERDVQDSVIRDTQKMMADRFLWIFCCTF